MTDLFSVESGSNPPDLHAEIHSRLNCFLNAPLSSRLRFSPGIPYTLTLSRLISTYKTVTVTLRYEVRRNTDNGELRCAMINLRSWSLEGRTAQQFSQSA